MLVLVKAISKNILIGSLFRVKRPWISALTNCKPRNLIFSNLKTSHKKSIRSSAFHKSMNVNKAEIGMKIN